MKPQYGLCLAISLALASQIQAEKFHFGQWINTDIAANFELHVFEMIILQEIQNCIESCKAKKQCKFINFNHRANLCYHIGSNSSMAFEREKKPGFYFGNKTEWNMVEYESCDECNDYGVCGLSAGGRYSKCQNSGCEPPENKTNAIFLGNMFSIGNRIEYECMEGYKTNKTVPSTSTCLENGTWSSVEVECLPVFEDKYYKFSLQNESWDSAKNSCSQLHGNLVHITSQAENDFIVDIIEKTNNSCYWIGGIKIDGVFTWLDGTNFTDSYTNWDQNEPNNSKGDEDCVNLLIYIDYMWNDAPCNYLCYFICEFI